MTTATRPSVGLTQFIDFTIKSSSAKINMVRRIKYQDAYHPSFDYWKQLREAIITFHEQGLSFDYFETFIKSVDVRKKENYTFAIRQYRKFLNGKRISWFNPGKATWVSNELVVRSSPELGLIIDGEPHLIKLYFKGEREKVNRRNIGTALTLLNTSIYEEDHDRHINRSVLNIHKSKLFTDDTINQDKLIALHSEAAQFMYIWNNI
ncbi:hypothetical protein [Geobacillus sp. FSL W8-1251]|uniref:hypothetical protein n=1 Tax=Geobacillus sp. FSL W8-1251 TaxID=2954650 RepID=UPI0030FB685A